MAVGLLRLKRPLADGGLKFWCMFLLSLLLSMVMLEE